MARKHEKVPKTGVQQTTEEEEELVRELMRERDSRKDLEATKTPSFVSKSHCSVIARLRK